MKTDATLHSLIMVGTDVYGRQRCRVAKAWALAGSLPQTATKSDSGKALSASAWIWPTLPQPIRAVRTRFIGSPRKMDCAHPPEKRQRLGHLFHTVHSCAIPGWRQERNQREVEGYHLEAAESHCGG